MNMWELARPLIEGWMMENMGPEARIREAADSMLGGLERLPYLVSEMEEPLGHAARHGIRVDPASLRALAGVMDAAATGASGRWQPQLWSSSLLFWIEGNLLQKSYGIIRLLAFQLRWRL